MCHLHECMSHFDMGIFVKLMNIYIYIYMCVYPYMCIYVYTYIYIYTYICMYVNTCIYIICLILYNIYINITYSIRSVP